MSIESVTFSAPGHEPVTLTKPGIDLVTGEVDGGYRFRAALKGATPIKRDKDGNATVEVTFVVGAAAEDIVEVARPILEMLAYTAAGAELEVVATPMARQGRMW